MAVTKKIVMNVIFFLILMNLVNAPYLITIDIEIINPEKTFSPGQDVIVSTNIRSLGELRDRIDIKLDYEIIDENGEMVTSHESMLAVHTTVRTTEYLTLPDNIKSGKYSVNVKLTYDNYSSSASESFYVESKFLFKLKEFINNNPLIFISGILILIILFAAIVYYLIERRH